MAKTSSIARELRRKKTVAKYAALRKELKEKGDIEALRLLPRDSIPNRLHNRCQKSGRSRAYMRKFGLSRIAFREMALSGKIPGIVKSSW
ncbi:MAG: 30S ribosomal protein S14 [Bacteroidetes bacterium]|nr:30S ribosomal protein S14 [Bacteroidota bacterium]